MGWFVSDADGTLADMKEFIDEARRAMPDIRFLLVIVPHRTRLAGRQDLIDKTNAYNKKLAELVAVTGDWFQLDSPTKLVDFNKAYSCSPDDGCPVGYDGLHPTARVEYQIASAFAEAFVNFYNVGRLPLGVPGPDWEFHRTIAVPTEVKAEAVPQGIKLSWKGLR